MMAVITHTVPLLPGPLTCVGSCFLLQNGIQQSLGSGPKARPVMKARAEKEREREGKKRETEVGRVMQYGCFQLRTREKVRFVVLNNHFLF